MKMFQKRKWWWWMMSVENVFMIVGVVFVIIYSSTEMLPNGWSYVLSIYWPFLVLGVVEAVALLFGRGGAWSSTALLAVGIGRVIKIIYPSVLINIYFLSDNMSQSLIDNVAILANVVTIAERLFAIALIVLAIVWHKLQQPKKVLSV